MERALKETLQGGAFSGVSQARSAAMKAIRGRGNRSTEIQLKMAMVRAGISGWEAHRTDLAGKPDFVFERKRLVVFVDGCFWHGCNQCAHAIRQNSEYWAKKVALNAERDKRTSSVLCSQGYRVMRFWEHELTVGLADCVSEILGALQGG